jgi:hypothetical protein
MCLPSDSSRLFFISGLFEGFGSLFATLAPLLSQAMLPRIGLAQVGGPVYNYNYYT